MDQEKYSTYPDIEMPEEESEEVQAADDEPEEEGGRRKRLFGRKRSEDKEVKLTADSEPVDLSRMKKKDLLEIMLRQGEEIDALRERVADLEAQLENKEFMLNRVGSIAEASLAVTEIFKEADKAAKIYLENIRRRINER